VNIESNEVAWRGERASEGDHTTPTPLPPLQRLRQEEAYAAITVHFQAEYTFYDAATD
jgi:hypothetical protein